MVDRPKKPSALAATPGLAPQPQVNITHSQSRVSAVLPTGESIEVLLYGATIISWKDAKGNEKLWLSEAAKLDGSKAVRGGIPLVFPVFGQSTNHPATSKLPQHGFARNSRWEFLGKSTSESAATPSAKAGDSGVKIDFGLSPSNLDDAAKEAWPYNFGLIYSITFNRDELETSILVRNEGDDPWEFQTLMHTYLRVNDISKVTIAGLNDSKYIDKVAAATKTESNSAISITGETDRVYTPSKGPEHPVIISEGGKQIFELVRDNLDNIVVWNPWTEKAKSMGDFEPKDGFKQMICVEAGQVNGWQKLEAGETFEGSQIIRSNL